MATPNPRGTPLTIGTVAFYDEEHPEELGLGLTQKIAEHELIGGGKVMQSLGPQPKPISWTGQLMVVGNTTPFARISQLNRMHADGKPQPLKYGPFAYDVVISDFIGTVLNENLGKYSITVKVLRDQSGQYSTSSTLSVDSQTQALMDQLQAKYNALQQLDASTAAWAAKLNAIASKLAVLGAIASASHSALQALLLAISAFMPTVSTYTSDLKNVVPTTTQTQMLSLAVGILSNLTVMQSNLSSGSTPLTVQVVGGSLHALAAQYYGDPTLWTTIAAANGLWTSDLPNGVAKTLIIPPAISTTQIG